METYLGTHVERNYQEQISGNICSGNDRVRPSVEKWGRKNDVRALPRVLDLLPFFIEHFTAIIARARAQDEWSAISC